MEEFTCFPFFPPVFPNTASGGLIVSQSYPFPFVRKWCEQKLLFLKKIKNKRSASVHSRFRSVKVFFYRPDGASFSPLFFFNGNERKTWQWVPRFSFLFFLSSPPAQYISFLYLTIFKTWPLLFFFLAGFVCYSTSSLANRFVYTSI